MIPHHVYYQLALLGLLWLCVLLHYGWPSRSATVPQRPAEPIKVRRKRSTLNLSQFVGDQNGPSI